MSLTDIELENLQWLADGKSQLQLSFLRGVSESTIKTQVKLARRKLGADTTNHAVAIAIRRGLID